MANGFLIFSISFLFSFSLFYSYFLRQFLGDGAIQYKDGKGANGQRDIEKENREEKQGVIPTPHRFQTQVPVPSAHSFKYIAALQSTIGAQHEVCPLLMQKMEIKLHSLIF